MARKMKYRGGRKRAIEGTNTLNLTFGLTVAKADVEALHEQFKICGIVYNHNITKIMPLYCTPKYNDRKRLIDIEEVNTAFKPRTEEAEKAGIVFFSEYDYEKKYDSYVKKEEAKGNTPVSFEEFKSKRDAKEGKLNGKPGKEYLYSDIVQTRNGEKVIFFQRFNDDNELIDVPLLAEDLKKVSSGCLIYEETKAKMLGNAL